MVIARADFPSAPALYDQFPLMGSIRPDGGIDVMAFARTMQQTCVFKNLTVDSIGLAQTGLQKLHAVKIPAGTLRTGDIIKLTIGVIKSGAADTATGKLTAGPLNTSSDLALINGPNLATTITSFGSTLEFEVHTTTTLRGVGAVNPGTSLTGGSTSSTWPETAIGDISIADLYIGLYYTMTSGAEFPIVRNFVVEIIPAVA